MDYIIIIIADVDLDVNPNEVRDTRYVSPEELKEMFKQKGIPMAKTEANSRPTIHTMVQPNLPKIPLRMVEQSRRPRQIQQRTRNNPSNGLKTPYNNNNISQLICINNPYLLLFKILIKNTKSFQLPHHSSPTPLPPLYVPVQIFQPPKSA